MKNVCVNILTIKLFTTMSDKLKILGYYIFETEILLYFYNIFF